MKFHVYIKKNGDVFKEYSNVKSEKKKNDLLIKNNEIKWNEYRLRMKYLIIS